jgi:hypothetical protein
VLECACFGLPISAAKARAAVSKVSAQNVAAFGAGKTDDAFLEIRVAVVSGPKPYTTYH